ncbi:uncharacterized protein SETTUDRAFT_137990 [Exserohilum turcica Et28A]|uniref:Mis12 domain-containing protein n=1 Tax=Exserohilum turcicum (strain 28A) TaxID=671987 RepID=R0IJQ3_EXST2|nr:uncharacterized protein SETTUDRAFT_137990 [Exserohilum turcica Et28A]EOA85370.1 hypothetical protein SETTUDRAFT_137990 [Exserohilum turcica Et28A]
MMASAKQQENMLLTEHFSWPPISLIDDIINAVNEVLYRCTDSFEAGLTSADPALLGFADLYASQKRTPATDEDGQNAYPEAALEIEEGVLKLETLMENAVDKNFDKLEIWTLRNVFALGRGKGEDEGLGDWVRLLHYENLQAPPKDSNLTPEALYALRRKLVETQKLHAALVAEKTRNEAQIARLKALLEPPRSSTLLSAEVQNGTGKIQQEGGEEEEEEEEGEGAFAFLVNTPAAQALGIQVPSSSSSSTGTTKPLATHTAFTTTQLPYLRHLLASLKPHLSTTALPHNSNSSTSTSTSDAKDTSTQRKLYVESQTKRVLERRGIDTRDGVEGVWHGERVAADEVRALEALVAGFGRGGNANANGKGKAGGGKRGNEEKEGEGDVQMDMDMEMEMEDEGGEGDEPEPEAMDTT